MVESVMRRVLFGALCVCVSLGLLLMLQTMYPDSPHRYPIDGLCGDGIDLVPELVLGRLEICVSLTTKLPWPLE